MDLDFMGGVPWASGWKTDAFECVAKFVVDALRKPYPFPSFSFRIWTDNADELAVDLTVSALATEVIHIVGGPFGGGTFFVDVGVSDDGYMFLDLPQPGQSISFTLRLTGTPKDDKLLTQIASRYRLIEKRRGG